MFSNSNLGTAHLILLTDRLSNRQLNFNHWKEPFLTNEKMSKKLLPRERKGKGDEKGIRKLRKGKRKKPLKIIHTAG